MRWYATKIAACLLFIAFPTAVTALDSAYIVEQLPRVFVGGFAWHSQDPHPAIFVIALVLIPFLALLAQCWRGSLGS